MKLKTRDLTVISLMMALSIIIPQLSPPLAIPPFTATFASHVPIIITTFISPWAALLTAVGSAIGFAIKLGDPFVTARAFSHIFFAVIAGILLKKKYNYVLVIILAMIIHGVSEAFMAVPLIHLVFPQLPVKASTYIILFGTFIHHIIDSVISIIILIPLSKAGFVDYEFSKQSITKFRR